MAQKTSTFHPQLIDELVKNCKTKKDVFGETGIIKQITKALLEKMLEGEMNTHLGYEKHEKSGYNTGNSRNGHTQKTLKTKDGEVEIRLPRDRNSDFEPQIIPKNQT